MTIIICLSKLGPKNIWRLFLRKQMRRAALTSSLVEMESASNNDGCVMAMMIAETGLMKWNVHPQLVSLIRTFHVLMDIAFRPDGAVMETLIVLMAVMRW